MHEKISKSRMANTLATLLTAVLFCGPSTTIAAPDMVSQHGDYPFLSASGDSCSFCHETESQGSWDRPDTWSDIPGEQTLEAAISVGRVKGAETTLFCLSCHDGVEAADKTASLMGGGYANGEYGSFTHPVSVGYAPGSLSGQTFQAAGLTTSASSHNGIDNLWFDGQVECVSCHAVHQENPRPNMLKTDKAHDTCMACHPM